MAISKEISKYPPGEFVDLRTGNPYFGMEAFYPIYNSEQAPFHSLNVLAANELLLSSTKSVCQKYKIVFAQLTGIQRKFLTHYRCDNCGMLPLYHINLAHIKRVRCRKCGQLVAFKGKGKYGKLRKAVAFELSKEIKGDV